jgi:hypothetical protein
VKSRLENMAEKLTHSSCVYAASLYTNNRYGTEWFVYLGAAACGITAGIFWAAEGAIMISCTLAFRNVWFDLLTAI